MNKEIIVLCPIYPGWKFLSNFLDSTHSSIFRSEFFFLSDTSPYYYFLISTFFNVILLFHYGRHFVVAQLVKAPR